jgi:hypothetical protein
MALFFRDGAMPLDSLIDNAGLYTTQAFFIVIYYTQSAVVNANRLTEVLQN